MGNASRMTTNNLQESAYDASGIYLGSPHLRHRSINQMLRAQLLAALKDAQGRGLPRKLVEVGAGMGGFVELSLAIGWDVTATDMAPTSVDELGSRYGGNSRFRALLDGDGDLAALRDDQFSAALYASVLHHIPDYCKSIDDVLDRLLPGGALITFQDPLWYPGMSRFVKALGHWLYIGWRLSQGGVLKGAAARVRRARGKFDESNPRDMVEYHVIRDGVNQEELSRRFRTRFEQFAVVPYWSAHSALGQAVGERLGVANTFAIIGTGYRG